VDANMMIPADFFFFIKTFLLLSQIKELNHEEWRFAIDNKDKQYV
jgi:hypothetical protein